MGKQAFPVLPDPFGTLGRIVEPFLPGTGEGLAANEICDSVGTTECVVNTTHVLTISAGESLNLNVDRDLHITATEAIVVDVTDDGAMRTLNINIANSGSGTGALLMGIGVLNQPSLA